MLSKMLHHPEDGSRTVRIKLDPPDMNLLSQGYPCRVAFHLGPHPAPDRLAPVLEISFGPCVDVDGQLDTLRRVGDGGELVTSTDHGYRQVFKQAVRQTRRVLLRQLVREVAGVLDQYDPDGRPARSPAPRRNGTLDTRQGHNRWRDR